MPFQPDVQAQFESLFKEFGIPQPTDGSGEKIDLAAAAAAATGAVAAEHVASQPKASGSAAKSAAPKSVSASKSAPAAAAAGPSSSSASTSAADASFQDTIRRTMERMQASGDQATAAAAADSESTDDMLSEFMKQMQSGGGLGGPGGEEDLTKMLVGMMEELTNKEILYEPMKELNDKFPAWMEANRSTTGAEDLKRYEEQQVIVREIVTRFEQPSYTDTNPDDREYIVDRMQKVSNSRWGDECDQVMESSYANFHRCKLQAPRHPTLWAICRVPRRPCPYPTILAISNKRVARTRQCMG